MRVRWRSKMMSQPQWRLRVDRRPSPTLAFAVSLVVHVLLVLMLCRAYTEFTCPPMATLEIVAREPLDPVPAGTFASDTPESATASDDVIQPVARVSSLPRPSTSLADAAFAPRGKSLQSARRATAAASLPSAQIEVPDVTTTPVMETSTLRAVAAAIMPLERADTLDLSSSATIADASPRLSPRPIYGPTERREVGLAILPANDVGTQRRERRPTAAFSGRGRVSNLPTENAAAIDRGLEYLARVQLDDGSWQFGNLRSTVDSRTESVMVRDDATATGLALLTYLGAGHDHLDDRYCFVIQDGLHFLARIQRQHGEFIRGGELPTEQITRFYSHGIATLALCEAYGMTGDEQLRAPAQRALDYLAGAQNPGIDGWRYLPGMNCDASVIGWQLAALRCGQLAGLSVRPETMTRIGECLAMSRDKATRPGQQILHSQTLPSTVTTAVGLAVELHLGGSPGDERLRPAAKELLANPPEVGDTPIAGQSGADDNPQRDTYYWYYGSQAMHYLGGEDWQAWSQQLYPKLMQSQFRDGQLAGSWEASRGGTETSPAYGGRLYVTAMNLLSLEIYNRNMPVEAAATPGISRKLQ